MERARLVLFAVLTGVLAAGCRGGVGFGVTLTATFDSTVTDLQLASVITLEIIAVAGESYVAQVPLGAGRAKRVERAVYRPLSSTTSVTLQLVATDATGKVVARGTSSAIGLSPGKTSSGSVTLASPAHTGKVIALRTATLVRTSASPVDVAVGQLDADNRLDLAVVSTASDRIEVFTQSADGSFPAKASFSATLEGTPAAVVVADWNGDGHADLLVADSTSGKVVCYVADGQGGFPNKITVTTLADVSSIAVADFDQDGAIDVASASSQTPDVFIHFNAQKADLTLAAGEGVKRLHVALLDAGPYPDLVAVTAMHIVGFRNASTAMSTAFFSADPVPAGYGPADVALGDFTGDGKVDGLAVFSNGIMNHDAAVLPNDGQGHLTYGKDISLSYVNLAVHCGAVDLDADGKLDIVDTLDLQGTYVGFGAANPAPPDYSRGVTYVGGLNETAFATGDLDGDGDLDVVVVNRGGSSVSILRTDPGPQLYAAHVVTGALSVVHAYDYNGDGEPDLGGTYGQHGLNLFQGDGLGNFDFGPTIVAASNTRPLASAVADLNSDGKPDVVYVDPSGALVVALAMQPGVFATPSGMSVTAADAAKDLLVGNFDGDAFPDAIVIDGSSDADTTSSNVRVFSGHGDGTFSASATYSAPGALHAAAAKVNVDGLQDVIELGKNSALSVFLQLPDHTFQTLPIQAVSVAFPSTMALARRGDGTLDVIVLGNTLGVMRGASDGTFASAGTLTMAKLAAIGSGDLDGDGASDVVATDGESLFTFRGTAAGYEPAGTFSAQQNVRELVVADFTGDGLADVVMAGDTLAFVLNVSK